MTLDLGDKYYEPYEQTQRQTLGIKEAVIGTAKTMGMMVALNAVGQAAFRGLSGLATKAIKRYGTGRIAGIARRSQANTLGDIARNTSAGKSWQRSFNSSTKHFRTALHRRSQLIQAAKAKGPLHGALKSLTSTFASKKTFVAATAKAAYDVGVVGAMPAYAIDNALGYTAEQYNLEKKEWYDVPGKVGNFAKWLAYDTVHGLGFKAATKSLGAIGAVAGLGVSKVFKGPLGKLVQKSIIANKRGMPTGFTNEKSVFNEKSLQWAATVKKTLTGRTVNRAMRLGSTFGPAVRALNNGILDSVDEIKGRISKSDPGSMPSKRSIGDPIKQALGQVKEMWHKSRESITQEYSQVSHPGLAGVDFAASLKEDVRRRGITGKQLNMSTFVDYYGSLAKEDKKTTLLDEIFGLKPLRTKDVVKEKWEQETRGVFKDAFVGNQGDLLMDHISNMRVGPGHYRAHGSGIKGGGVDLSMFDPLRSVKRVANAVLLKPYKIPLLGLNINIGDMFGVNTWTSEAPSVTFWSDKRSYKIGEHAARQAKGMKNIFPKGISPISTADVGDNVWKTVYLKSGKLAFFTDQGVETLDWNRRLMFDYQQGARRHNETAWIKNREAARNAELSNTLDKKEVRNEFLGGWLDYSNLSFPSIIRRAKDKLSAKLRGKNTAYKSLANLIGTDIHDADIAKHQDVFQSLRTQSMQEFMPSLSRPGALDTLGATMGRDNLGGDLFDFLNNRRAFQERLKSVDTAVGNAESWGKYLSRMGLQEEVDMVTAFPGKGGQPTVKGFGSARELTVEDRLRGEILSHTMNKEWSGQGVHPMVDAADKLFEEGFLNNHQMKAMKVFGHLSAFNDTGVFYKHIDTGSKQVQQATRRARERLNNTAHRARQDVLAYIDSTELKATRVKLESELGGQRDPFVAPLNRSAYVSTAMGWQGAAMDSAGGILESVTNMMAEITIPFKKDPIRNYGIKGNLKYLTSSMLKIAAANVAFNAVDAALAGNPLLDETFLNTGVKGAVADVAATGRLTSSRVLDAIGVTGVAKHLDGLLPGFVTSAPGALIGGVVSRTMGGGMAKGMALGAIGNRILSPFLPDFTKDYEQLEDEYSGKTTVPIMKSPMWLIGPTPWEGQKVEGYSPNWYVRTKSRWEESDTLYGSTFRKFLHEPIFPVGVSIGDFVDPYFMSRKHYFSRPYPQCFEENTLVQTVNGLKKIKELTVHDSVYDLNGNITEIYSVANRPLKKEEIVYRLRTIGSFKDEIVTSDHRFPVVSEQKCKYSSQHNKSCISSFCGICDNCKQEKNTSIVWKKTKDINVGDYIVKPIISRNFIGTEIDPCSFISRNFKKEDNEIVLTDKLGRKTKHRIKDEPIKINDILAYYFGLFLSEGWITKSRGKNSGVGTVHNIKEKNHILPIIIEVSKYFDANFFIKETDTYIEVVISSWCLSDLVYYLYGSGCATKKTKFLSEQHDRHVVAGILFGDGHYDSSQVVLTSTSLNILNYVTTVLENDYIPTCIKKHCNNGHQSYRLSFSMSYLSVYKYKYETNYKNENISIPNRCTKIPIFDNYLLKKVLVCQPTQSIKNVYDISVKSNTSSFCLLSIAAHNSGRWGEEIPLVGPLVAGTLGQLIKPQKTMHQEFLNGTEQTPSTAEQTYPFANPPPTLQEGMGMMKDSWNTTSRTASTGSLFGTFQYASAQPWSYGMGEEFLYNVQNFAGLKGFVAGSVSEKIFNKPTVIPTLETAGRLASQGRFYGDANLGGLGFMCLPPDEKVLTPHGLQAIKDIAVGDIVYDDNYMEQTVRSIMNRYTRVGEKLYSITVGASKTTIETTDKHPWAIYKRLPGNDNKKRSLDFEWVPAEDIVVGDFAVMPRRQGEDLMAIFSEDLLNGQVLITNDYLYVQITDVQSRPWENQRVYDIEVSNSHCFIGNYALLHNSEPIRRIVQKRDSRKYGINPIPNMFPNFLPAEFLTGDAYSKIVRGELRLPGKAYELTHATINKSMPGRSSMFGGTLDHIVQYYTGLLSPMLKEQYDILEKGDTIHAQIQDQLAAEGLLVQAERLVYDVKNDISGHVDAIIKDGTGGGGKKAMEIKSINEKAFAKMDGPKQAHIGQLNFYMRQLGMHRGSIMYVNRENPSQIKTYEVNYSKHRFEKDLEKLQKARQIATDAMSDGIGDRFGYTYSWLDRLEILSDVAPHSNEFKEAKYLVEQQIKANILTQREIDKYHRVLKQKQARIRKYELYPSRFKGVGVLDTIGNVLSPDTEVNIQSINENIKAASEYGIVSRSIGALWETFTNSNNYLTNKFFAFKDPLQHYKQLKLYGKEYAPWDDPWGSFAEPQLRNFMAKESPGGGAYKGGVIGFVVGGGPIGSVIGGTLGAAYGAVNGLVRGATDSAYIPGVIKEQREVNSFFDSVKFERYSRMSQLSEGLLRKEYQDAANATLNAYNNQTDTNVGNLFRATPYLEKPYISSFLNETDPKKRQEILRFLPDDLAKALDRTWGKEENAERTQRYISGTSEAVAEGYNGPQFDRSLLDPSVKLEDIKLKTVNEAGLNAHDFGIGWNEQQVRMQDNYNRIAYVKRSDINGNTEAVPIDISPAHVRYSIIETLRNRGIKARVNAYINNGADDANAVTVTVRRDRAQAVTKSLQNRKEYLG